MSALQKKEGNKENVDTSNHQKRKSQTGGENVIKITENISRTTTKKQRNNSDSSTTVVAAEVLVELSTTTTSGIRNYYKSYPTTTNFDVGSSNELSQTQTSRTPQTTFGLKANNLLSFTPIHRNLQDSLSPVECVPQSVAETLADISSSTSVSSENQELDTSNDRDNSDSAINETESVNSPQTDDTKRTDQCNNLDTAEIDFEGNEDENERIDENQSDLNSVEREYLTATEKRIFCNYVECVVTFQDKEKKLQQCIQDLHLNISTEIGEFHCSAFKEYFLKTIRPVVFKSIHHKIYDAPNDPKALFNMLNVADDVIEAREKNGSSQEVEKRDYNDVHSLLLFTLRIMGSTTTNDSKKKKELRKIKNALRKRLDDLHTKVAKIVYSLQAYREYVAEVKESASQAKESKEEEEEEEEHEIVATKDETAKESTVQSTSKILHDVDDEDSDNSDESENESADEDEEISGQQQRHHQATLSDDEDDEDEDDEEDEEPFDTETIGELWEKVRNCKYAQMKAYPIESTSVNFEDSHCRANVILVEAQVWQLLQPNHPYSLNPHHITVIIGSPAFGLYMELLHYIQVTHCKGPFENLKSLTFMVPLAYLDSRDTLDEFCSLVMEHLPPGWKCTSIEYNYNTRKSDMRMLLVFTSYEVDAENKLSAELISKIKHGYQQPRVKYGFNLAGGVHALRITTVIDLIQFIDIREGDTFWELGCGEMNLAFALSSAACGGQVIGTETGDVMKTLTQTIRIYDDIKLSKGKRTKLTGIKTRGFQNKLLKSSSINQKKESDEDNDLSNNRKYGNDDNSEEEEFL